MVWAPDGLVTTFWKGLVGVVGGGDQGASDRC